MRPNAARAARNTVCLTLPASVSARPGVESGTKGPEHLLHRAHRGAYHDHVRAAGRFGRVQGVAVHDPEIARAAKVRFAPARPHHLADLAGAAKRAREGPADEPHPDDAQALDHAAGPGAEPVSIARIDRMPGVAAIRSNTFGSMGRSTSTRV